MKRAAAVFGLFLLVPSLRGADLSSADFLNIATHARPLAQGEAAVASVKGVGAAFLNPAALAGTEGREFSFTHGTLVEDSYFGQAAFALNIRGHAVSVSHFQLTHGSLDRRDASGAPAGGFTPQDTVLSLGYGTTRGRLRMGAAVKRIESRIIKEADAVTLDAGGQYGLAPDMDLGLALSNAVGELKYDQESTPLPRTLRAGLHWRAMEPLHLNLGAVMPARGDFHLDMGGEYRFQASGGFSWALRAGYNGRTPDLRGFSGLNGGMGISFRQITLDYALDPFGDFGLTHRWSLDYAW